MPITDLLKHGKDEATAIGGVEGAKPLTYAGLRQLASRTIARLNELASAAAIAWPSSRPTDRRWPPPSCASAPER